jgi:formylglycine-generating enzyme required for sulfatase activity
MEELQYFFSYTRKDSAFVLRLAKELREVRVNLWLDQLDILGGQHWDRAVEGALQTCQGMIAVLSPDALASNNVMDEVSYALEERKIVIPILLHPCTIPFRLRRVQYIDFTADYNTGFSQLLRALRIDQPLPARAPAVPEDTVVQDVAAPVQQTPREVPIREQLPRRAEPPESGYAVPEETLETGVAASMQPPLEQASHGDGKPFDPAPQQEEAAPPLVSAKNQPAIHRYTTSDTRDRPKRRLLWGGGVLLCVLVTALYFAFLERAPGLQPQSRPTSVQNQKNSKLTSPLTNSLGMQFALIPAGEFQMGSTSGDNDERPVRTVRIGKPFYLGIHEVTQSQWEAVMGNNPSQFKGDANRPVETVSWEEVQKFIGKLNTKEGGTKYRLPTEAEWEYAARAGSTTAYSFGDDSSQLGKHAWFGGNAGNTTHPVGTLQPNAWGLYDMYGNVWEWVQDWYGKYTVESVTDPQGPASGSHRVGRGGSWFHDARNCRSADRYHDAPGFRSVNLGFRLLRTAP